MLQAKRTGGSFLRRRAQRGAYALEFALVFPVLFLLVYGIFTYGLIFTAQQSLSLAAEEGARAMLRYDTNWDVEQGCKVAADAADWLQSFGGKPACSGSVSSFDCGYAADQQCTASIVVTYDYAGHPLVPRLPGMGLLTPDVLSSQASVTLDLASLHRNAGAGS